MVTVAKLSPPEASA